jgi:pSer/pThr/pTyr-binding forkhead associated (FHA) protein
MATLRVTTGPSSGSTIEVIGQVVLGRHDVDYAIVDAEVSRRHAVVRSVDDALEVEDLGSANGTFVDGERLTAPVAVGGGAKIRLGSTVFVVEAPLPPLRTNPPELDSVDRLRPSPRRRRRRAASRSWVLLALSYATVIATAIALVVYFATR